MFRTVAFLPIAFAALSVADAKLADKYENPFAINTDCGQFGEMPVNLTDSLPAGYDYNCYEGDSPYIKRWSTTTGINASKFLSDPADLMPSLIAYLMELIPFLVPILGFGIISVISCTCWSCGMLDCCAGKGDKSRKCCGKCCANPPKFTEGFCEWILMAFTIFLGVCVVGLAIKGLEINKVQNQAIDDMANAVSMLDSWVTNTDAKMNATMSAFGNVLEKSSKMQTDLTDLKVTAWCNKNRGGLCSDATDAFTTGTAAAADALSLAMTAADESVGSVADTVGGLSESVADMSGMFDTVGNVNEYRNSGLKIAWIVLVLLMLWELSVAFLKQYKPEVTSHTTCDCIFGTVTFLYIVILFVVFLVLTVVAVVTVLFGDICKSPDGQIIGIVGGALGGAASSDDVTTTSTPAPGDTDGGFDLPLGPDLFTYYIECDTNTDLTNPFNGIVGDVLGQLASGTDSTEDMQTAIDAAEQAYKAYEENCNTPSAGSPKDCDNAKALKAAFDLDKATIELANADLTAAVSTLLKTIGGADGTDAVPTEQGMTDGLFSVVNCYQVNTRYQATINMLCGKFFETLAMTVEYLLVAAVFMVVVEFCKRWMRPYNLDHEVGNQVHPAGEARWDVAKGQKTTSENAV